MLGVEQLLEGQSTVSNNHDMFPACTVHERVNASFGRHVCGFAWFGLKFGNHTKQYPPHIYGATSIV